VCGMAGWVSYDRDLRAHLDVVKSMTDTMSRRGPDAEGIWVEAHVSLGHRRLAIIDLEGGAQPMIADEAGHALAALVYTGEVYNFTELRAELTQLGHRFRSRSDTEVILRGYLQWGAEVAERLNGMFACAVWDCRTEELLLIRDRLGVKPLFYYATADGVLFGSEPKAILAHPWARPRVNRDGLCEMLLLVKNPERTVYAGMAEVQPGQIVRVRRSGLTKRRYWKLEAADHVHELSHTISTVRDLLEDTVTRQIVSDVPLCSLLSGGLDSSAITAMAQQAASGRVRSFSVDFVGHGADFVADRFHSATDTPYVRDFVAHTGAEHTEIVLRGGEIAEAALHRAVIRAGDFPLGASGDMYASLYRFFERIKATSTVALSGEAADEVFGGYSWFHDPKTVCGETFPWRAISGAGTRMLSPDVLAKLDLEEFEADSYAQALAEVPAHERDDEQERRMRQVCFLHLTRLMPFLLDRKDRMSMAVGLEVRVPFCDHRLVEYVFNVPWRVKTFDGRAKSLLRAAVAHLLPQSILGRDKCPYPATQDPDYEKRVRQDVAALVTDPGHPAAGLFNRRVIQVLIARPMRAISSLAERVCLETVRSIGTWVKDYGVILDL
jgi:asparagine synthase (glutamine-hydrolysing)